MSHVPIIIAGHSHAVAIVGRELPPGPVLQPATKFPDVFALHGPWPRDQVYWDALKSHAAGANIAIVWRGNEHNEYFFFQSGQPFDLYYSRVPFLSKTYSILPQQQIRKFFKPHYDELKGVLQGLGEANPGTICLVGTPPPKNDDQYLRQVMAAEPHFLTAVAFRNKSVDDVEITPPHVRLKLWYLVQDMLREVAAQHAVDFIEVPDEVRDREGFLKREYWYSDVTHANELYGELMAERIVRSLR